GRVLRAGHLREVVAREGREGRAGEEESRVHDGRRCAVLARLRERLLLRARVVAELPGVCLEKFPSWHCVRSSLLRAPLPPHGRGSAVFGHPQPLYGCEWYRRARTAPAPPIEGALQRITVSRDHRRSAARR